jgi:predicted metalloprotease
VTRPLRRAVVAAAGAAACSALLAGCAPPAASVERSADTAASVDWVVIETEITRHLRAVDDVWAEEYPQRWTGEFRSPLNVWSFDSADEDAMALCAGDLLPSDNAVFCPGDDSVIWDEQLMRTAWGEGEAALAVIVAHEWAHVVQYQYGFTEPWTALELQADCFAGAALAAAGARGTIEWSDAAEDRAASALAGYGDPEPWGQPGDHGDAVEREAAFRLGAAEGVDGCRADPEARGD